MLLYIKRLVLIKKLWLFLNSSLFWRLHRSCQFLSNKEGCFCKPSRHLGHTVYPLFSVDNREVSSPSPQLPLVPAGSSLQIQSTQLYTYRYTSDLLGPVQCIPGVHMHSWNRIPCPLLHNLSYLFNFINKVPEKGEAEAYGYTTWPPLPRRRSPECRPFPPWPQSLLRFEKA